MEHTQINETISQAFQESNSTNGFAGSKMCNAWNHSLSCSCKFGGDSHSNQSSRDIILISFQSYVNPFARCPVCGESVFFFEASNGGRVFFDELGPPWSKHPCTDRSLESSPVEHDRKLL